MVESRTQSVTSRSGRRVARGARRATRRGYGMGAYLDFARVFWSKDIDGMGWSATCGAEAAIGLRSMRDAVAQLLEHAATCESCDRDSRELVSG
jgi:hypothetical protein